MSSTILARPNPPTYERDQRYPFGRPNPDAPAELAQFHFMIGSNDCVDERRNSSDGEWTSGKRTWDAHYTMNGFAIMDTGRSGQTSNGNIRIYDVKEKLWNVTFFSMPLYFTGVWKGSMMKDKMVLKQPKKAPGSGSSGTSRLTFSDISSKGFNWVGEWVSADGSIVYPFWRISCKKVLP